MAFVWAKTIYKEPNRKSRQLKEAIWIKKTPMNRDEGYYELYDDIIHHEHWRSQRETFTQKASTGKKKFKILNLDKKPLIIHVCSHPNVSSGTDKWQVTTGHVVCEICQLDATALSLGRWSMTYWRRLVVFSCPSTVIISATDGPTWRDIRRCKTVTLHWSSNYHIHGITSSGPISLALLRDLNLNFSFKNKL